MEEGGFAVGVEVERFPGESDGGDPVGELFAVFVAVAVEGRCVGVECA